MHSRGKFNRILIIMRKKEDKQRSSYVSFLSGGRVNFIFRTRNSVFALLLDC